MGLMQLARPTTAFSHTIANAANKRRKLEGTLERQMGVAEVKRGNGRRLKRGLRKGDWDSERVIRRKEKSERTGYWKG